MNKRFVITVASEKGGVGKTTIATNLAVYLKALREDLPVTIVSFDNHFSVDQMFALGPTSEHDVSSLLQEGSCDGLVALGQYGVQYISSSRRIQQPPQEPTWLLSRINDLKLSGVLIIDTRPILDWFTEAALLAADLVLTPIKDRAALMNTGALRHIMSTANCEERLWLLPSLVDTRARLNADVKVHQFLTCAARERDYQVLDLMISKSPKVEGLASGFASRIRPVLTHARNTTVHGQFKLLAEFVLGRYEKSMPRAALRGNPSRDQAGAVSKMRGQIDLECPACGQQIASGVGHYFSDRRSRKKGLLHPECFLSTVSALEFDTDLENDQVIVLLVNGPGHLNMDAEVTAFLYDSDSSLIESKGQELKSNTELDGVLEGLVGRKIAEAYREVILVQCHNEHDQDQLPDKGFVLNRKSILRDLLQAGYL